MGGSTASHSNKDETSLQIMKQKNEIEFKHVDFIKEVEDGSIETEYEMLSPCLQQNQFFELRKAIHIKTKLIRKVYIINKYKIRSNEREALEAQINRLKKVDDPGLLKIYELFKNNHKFYIVLEYSSGDSLARLLQKQRKFQQRSAASIMYQMLILLNHCHKKEIFHGDLKLESICFNSKRQDTIKIEDFSISKIFRIEEILSQSEGRALICSPETLANQLTTRSDIWSCGVILYILLSGEAPNHWDYQNQTFPEAEELYVKCYVDQPTFKEKGWSNVSQEALQIIKKMMKVVPNERPTAQELLEHPWFKKYYVAPTIARNKLKHCLRQLYLFKVSSKLQEATWTFFVNALISFEEKQFILSVFVRLDYGSKGQIDENDLAEGFKEFYGEKTGKKIASKLMKRLGKKRIVYSEFVTYCASRFFLITEPNLLKIFNIFDEDSSGQISVGQLRDTLGNSKQVSEQIWLQLMKEADSNSDGKISLNQFRDMLKQLKNVDGEGRPIDEIIFTDESIGSQIQKNNDEAKA